MNKHLLLSLLVLTFGAKAMDRNSSQAQSSSQTSPTPGKVICEIDSGKTCVCYTMEDENQTVTATLVLSGEQVGTFSASRYDRKLSRYDGAFKRHDAANMFRYLSNLYKEQQQQK